MPIESSVPVALLNESQVIQWPIPCDWQLYQRPTLFRREGCRYFPVSTSSNQTPPDVLPVLKAELVVLATSYGGNCLPIAEQTLLIFPDSDRALRCQQLLEKRGVSSLRCEACLVLPVLSP
jgi:hypothetical protein